MRTDKDNKSKMAIGRNMMYDGLNMMIEACNEDMDIAKYCKEHVERSGFIQGNAQNNERVMKWFIKGIMEYLDDVHYHLNDNDYECCPDCKNIILRHDKGWCIHCSSMKQAS